MHIAAAQQSARTIPPAEAWAYPLGKSARLLGVSIATVRRLHKAGHLELVKVAGRTVVTDASLRAYFSRQREAA